MGTPRVDFTNPVQGLFLVKYRVAEDLLPDRQAPLIQAIERVPAPTPVALVFDVDVSIRNIDMSVPTFWLGTTSRKELRLRRFAIVSTRIAVKVAATAFGLANQVRGLEVESRTFESVQEALAWAQVGQTGART